MFIVMRKIGNQWQPLPDLVYETQEHALKAAKDASVRYSGPLYAVCEVEVKATVKIDLQHQVEYV